MKCIVHPCNLSHLSPRASWEVSFAKIMLTNIFSLFPQVPISTPKIKRRINTIYKISFHYSYWKHDIYLLWEKFVEITISTFGHCVCRVNERYLKSTRQDFVFTNITCDICECASNKSSFSYRNKISKLYHKTVVHVEPFFT